MSIKLYTGFYLDAPLAQTLPLLKEATSALSGMAEEKLKNGACEKLYQLWLKVVDGLPIQQASEQISDEAHLLKLRYAENNPLFWAAEVAWNLAEKSEATEISSEVDKDCHVELNVTLFPDGDRTMGIAYGASEFTSSFLSLPFVHEYFFWNNTDAPEDIPLEEWQVRRVKWDAVLPSGIPRIDGFRYDILSVHRMWRPAINADYMDAWLSKNRKSKVETLAVWMMREDFLKFEPENNLKTFIRCHDRACQELTKKSPLYETAREKAEKRIPTTWEAMKTAFAEQGTDG